MSFLKHGLSQIFMRFFLFLLLIISNSNVKAQGKFYQIVGIDYFPDSTTIRKNGITEIRANEISYRIYKRDTIIERPSYIQFHYFNNFGQIDSLISWTSNDNDSLFRDFQRMYIYNHKNVLTQLHSERYFCSFKSAKIENNWCGCLQDLNTYYIYDNYLISVAFDSSIFETIAADSTKLSAFNNGFRFYENDKIVKDSIYFINHLGIVQKRVWIYFYDKKDNLNKVNIDTCSDAGCFNLEEIRYEYDDQNNLIRVTKYNSNLKEIIFLQELKYNKKGELIYEEVGKQDIGIKSRAYKYDANGRMEKIKEKHFGGGVYIYYFMYNELGFLESITKESKRFKHKEVTSFTYIQ